MEDRDAGGAATALVLGQVLAASGSSVTFLTPDALASAPRRVEGQPGLEVAELAKQPGYSVLELRRTGPGSVEVHAEWADGGRAIG
jgi:hypothetical protein